MHLLIELKRISLKKASKTKNQQGPSFLSSSPYCYFCILQPKILRKRKRDDKNHFYGTAQVLDGSCYICLYRSRPKSLLDIFMYHSNNEFYYLRLQKIYSLTLISYLQCFLKSARIYNFRLLKIFRDTHAYILLSCQSPLANVTYPLLTLLTGHAYFIDAANKVHNGFRVRLASLVSNFE